MSEDSGLAEVGRVGADGLRALASATPVTSVIAQLTAVPNAYRTRQWMAFVNELLTSFDAELELLGAAVSDERMSGLLEHAQRLAEAARSERKIRLAARAVASVFRGNISTEQVETAHVLLSLLEPLETHHLEVLAVLGSSRPDDEVEGQEATGAWSMSELRERLPQVSEIVSVLIASLISAGLATDRGPASVTYGGLGRHQLDLTDAGRWLLTRLQLEDIENSSDPG